MAAITPGFPSSYAIRELEIRPSVVLAPMEGVTDLPFRRVIRRASRPGLTYCEFIASKALVEGGDRVWRNATFDADERPIALQIFGRDPELMAEAARLLEAHGASVIDLNMGCPAKRVCANSGGSSLMKEPDLAARIVAAVRAAIRVPLTVKMRSGFDHAQRNAPELAWRCQEEGADAITIHWRTRADRYQGERAVDRIAAAVARLRIPVVGNGDIVDLASARAMFADTGCSGVMVGRGAMRNPWLIRQIGDWLEGREPFVPSRDEQRRALVHYFDEIEAAFTSDKGALGRFKMFANLFCEELPGGDVLRQRLVRARATREARDVVDSYFAAVAGVAPEAPALVLCSGVA